MDATNLFPHPTRPTLAPYNRTQTHTTLYTRRAPVTSHPSTFHTHHTTNSCSNNLFITILPSPPHAHSLSPILARLASQSHAQDCRQQHPLNRLTRRAGRSSSPLTPPARFRLFASFHRPSPSSGSGRSGCYVLGTAQAPPPLGIDCSVRARPFCDAPRTVSARTLFALPTIHKLSHPTHTAQPYTGPHLASFIETYPAHLTTAALEPSTILPFPLHTSLHSPPPTSSSAAHFRRHPRSRSPLGLTSLSVFPPQLLGTASTTNTPSSLQTRL
jgi:hypothetical protein